MASTGRNLATAAGPAATTAGSLDQVQVPARRYLVRTFGCQMNEHDSERIAGLLEADGMVAATSEADADVVVLNTCCIRENADNKLYGNLGHLKTWKAAARRPPDRRVRLPRPEGPRRRAPAGRPRRRRDGHAQRAPRRRAARRGAAQRADHRDPRGRGHRRPRHVPVGAAGTAHDVVQRLGHDPDRLRQHVRLLHRPRRARRGDQPPVRRHRRRGRSARRRRRHRGDVARAERQQLRPRPPARRPPRRRPHAPRLRPLFADLLEARRRRRGHPPRPLHVATPQGHASRDVRGDGVDARRVRAVALPAAVGVRPRPQGDAPRLHGGALPRSSRRGPPQHPRPRRLDRHHRRLSRARPTTTSRRRSRSAAEARFDDAFTFIFSPRPRHRGGDDDGPLRRSGGGGGALRPSARRRRAQRPRRQHRPRSDASRRCSSRGRARSTPRCSPVARGSTASSTSPHRRRCAPAPTPTSRSPAPPRTTSAPASSSRPPTPAIASGSRSPSVDAAARRPARPDRIGQVRGGDGCGRRGCRRRDRRRRRDAGVPADGHRHGEADRRRSRRRRPPLPRPRRSERRDVGHRVPPRLRRRPRRNRRAPAQHGRSSSPVPGCT